MINSHISYKNSHSKNTSNLSYIGPSDNSGQLCKYKNLKDAEQWIENGTIRFVEPSSWNDPYEKLFYEADLKKELEIDFSQKVLAFCVTTKMSNEAAWVVYKYGKKYTMKEGLVVQMVINQQKFRRMLSEFAHKNPAVKLYEGRVNYKCKNTITRIRTKTDVLHKKHFFPSNGFNINHFLSLLLIKRKAFDYENEIRYFLIVEDESLCKKDMYGHLYFDLSIPLADCLTKVVIDHEAEKENAADITSFEEICKKNKIKYTYHNLYNKVKGRIFIDR